MSERLDIERQNRLEPLRTQSCQATLEGMGYEVAAPDLRSLHFVHNGHPITLWPYSGWFTGKCVVDGRGFNRLVKQLVPQESTV